MALVEAERALEHWATDEDSLEGAGRCNMAHRSGAVRAWTLCMFGGSSASEAPSLLVLSGHAFLASPLLNGCAVPIGC